MKYKKGNKILEIEQDDSPLSPREWDNLGTMVCFHRRYDLGDEHTLNFNEFSGWDDIKEHLIKERDAVVILPLYLYDHSGLYLKVGDFHGMLSQGHARFDSGQVGFICATKENIRKWFGVKRISKKVLERTDKILRQEVEAYAKYLVGDLYNFTLYELVKCDKCGNTERKVIDSCCGFYGTEWAENGLLEHAGIKSLAGWEEVEE